VWFKNDPLGRTRVKSDLKHIEFFDENKFEENFVELITVINAAEVELDLTSTK